MQFNLRNPNNKSFADQYVLELMQVENATIEEFNMESEKLAYVLANHKQKIFQIETGKLKGYWKTFYYDEHNKRQSVTYKSKKKLVLWLEDHIREGEGKNKTFETVYSEMVEFRQVRMKRKPKTIDDYKNVYNRFMRPLADMRISDITEDNIRDWIVDIVLPPKPPYSAFKRLMEYLALLFKFAGKRHYITANPLEDIIWQEYSHCCSHKRKAGDDEQLSVDECRALREQMYIELEKEVRPTTLLVLLNMELGTRSNEPSAIRKEDVRNNCINIHRQITRINYERPYVYGEEDYTKDTNNKDVHPRELEITPHIRAILDLCDQLPGDSVYLVHDANGNFISPETYRQYLSRWCKRLGIKKTDGTFKTNNHCLRKTFSTMLSDIGVDDSDAAEIMGHSVRIHRQNYQPTRSTNRKKIGADIAKYQEEQDRNNRSLNFTQ